MKYALGLIAPVLLFLTLLSPFYGAKKIQFTGEQLVFTCTIQNIWGQKVELFAEVRCAPPKAGMVRARAYFVWKEDLATWNDFKLARSVPCSFKTFNKPVMFGILGSTTDWSPELPCRDTWLTWPQQKQIGMVKRFD